VIRRSFCWLVLALPAALCAATTSLRGRLTKSGDKPAIESGGKLTTLSGDEDSIGVVLDKRLAGTDFEALGTQKGDGFAIAPIHTRSMFVHKDGKRLAISYWCDICAIRTYTPGLCWCCREETDLQLREPDKVDSK
jgi:hypothetical protein